MSTRDLDKVERTPGRLILTPTDLAGANPTYGGTELGAVRGVEWEPIAPIFPINYEEFGGPPGEAIEGAEWTVFYALIRQNDATALGHIFRNTSTGSSGRKVVSWDVDGTVRAGALASARAAKILFVPDNVSDHEAVYLPLAFPMIVGESRIALSILKERNIAVAWLGFPDASGFSCKHGLIGDLTL